MPSITYISELLSGGLHSRGYENSYKVAIVVKSFIFLPSSSSPLLLPPPPSLSPPSPPLPFPQPPTQELSLDFIFGYRGFDTRQNAAYASDGSVVYPAAGAAVVYNPLTNRQSFYLEHNDDIITLVLNRNSKLSQVAATG